MVLHSLGELIVQGIKKLGSEKKVDKRVYLRFISEIFNALKSADVSSEISKKFINSLNKKIDFDKIPPGLSPKKVIENAIFNELITLVSPGTEPYKPQRKYFNIFMLVGLQGAGKTTTITKLANYYKRRNWKVGVIAADTFRAGAREQLMQNAQSVGIPYYVDFSEQDPVKCAMNGVEKFKKEKFEMVFIDTSGRHMQEQALFEEMKAMADAVEPDEIIFVMDGTIGQAAYEQALGFKNAVGVGSIIVTKLDSNAKGGGAISAIAATNSPISFFGSGEAVNDLEGFDPSSFISRLLGYSDPKVFQNALDELDTEKTRQVSEHILNGQFNFQDLYNQYSTIMDFGNFNQMLESIGNSQNIAGGLKNKSPEETKETVRRILLVIESMSKSELENPSLLKDNKRKLRISAGSGMSPAFVQYVIDEQKKWEKMFKRMDKRTLSLMAQNEMPKFDNERQFQEQIQKMAKAMDPQMLKSVGGVEGLEASMRQSWNLTKK